MREILKDLNATRGVHGSAVVLEDGVIVAAELAAGTDPDSFAALVSSFIAQATRSLPKLQLSKVKRAMVTASRGCFALTSLGGAFLVAELERDVEPSVVDIELESAAGRLRRLMRPRGESNVPAALPVRGVAPEPARVA
ncbi:MAG: roadblock/LC7 domain-containing protein [Planctomycetes bacterium]|nr:roadblock/LC7 domain-containing protein [Planctomycetota bacterium]